MWRLLILAVVTLAAGFRCELALGGQPPALINVDLGYPDAAKTGPAAVGQGPNDFWNVGWYSPLANVWYANGAVSSVTISIINGIFGSSCGSTDPMYNSYVFNNYYASDVSVTAANLIPGVYDFYAYSPEATFTLRVGTNNLGSKVCVDSPLTNPPSWQEGRQYVRYANVPVGTGEVVTLTSGGLGKISGWQIAAVETALAMLDQPQSQTVNAGDNIVLTVNTIGNPTANYQWLRDGTNVAGATASTLALTNVQFSQQANYSVLASNAFGTIYSSNAFLTVQAAPVIHEQPTSLVLGAGSDAFFHVVADGSPPLIYQWLFNGSNVPGATTSSLTISNVQTANLGDYVVSITNNFGPALSDTASLLVTGTVPTIVSSPASLTATRGAPVELQVVARGTDPLSYAWLRNGFDLPGQSQATLRFEAVQPGDAGAYQARVTNIQGTALSEPATLAVTPPPGFLWARPVGGTDNDEAKCAAVDADGNVYMAGYFRGTTPFGTTNLVSAGGPDIFLAKYDRFGQLLWARQGGSSSVFYPSGSFSPDVAFGLTTDAAGNVYITGSFTGTAHFGNFSLTKAAGAALFLAKYSSSGDILWAIQSSGSGTAQGNGLCVGPDGNIFLAGVFTGTNTLATNNVPLTAPGSSNGFFVACFDGDGRAVWTKKGSGNGRSLGRAIAAARDGTIYVTGEFSGIANFDGIELVENAAYETGDIFVAAYEPGGNVLWATTAGGFYADSGAGIAADSAGSAYVTGSFKGVARFGEVTLSAGTVPEIFVARYGHDGKVQWAKSAGGSAPDYGNSVAVDSGGNAYVAGSFYGTANFSGTSVSSYGAEDAFVAMYTAAGNLVWVRNAGGSGADTAASVCADATGNVYLAGSFSGSITLGYVALTGAGGRDAYVSKLAAIDPGLPPAITLQPSNQTFAAGINAALSVGFIGGPPLSFQWQLNGVDLPGETHAALTFHTLQPTQGGDYSLVLANSSGAVTSTVATVSVVTEPDYLWSRGAGGAANEEATAVAIDASGNVYVAGQFSGTADFGGTALVSRGGEDIFVAKYDKAGTLLWVSQVGGSENDRATGLALDSTGTRVLVAGFFSGSMDLGVTNLTSVGGTDIILAQFDWQGNLVGASQAGGSMKDAALGVAVDESGSAVITGYYQGTARFDGTTLNGGTTNEIFVAKYNAVGRVVWARSAGGSSADTGRAIACDRKGHIYVAGSFYGSATIGSFGLSSPGDLGIFIAQYNSANGSVLWARQAGASGLSDDEALALCADREGNALVSGYIQNQAWFASNMVSSFSSNAPDVFLAKYDVEGNLAWVQQAGGIFKDYGNGLATDGCGNAYLAGTFAGTARFGNSTLDSIGSSDFFVALYDSAGQLVKVRHGGSGGTDAAQAVAADGKGGVVAAGYYGADSVIGGDLLVSLGGRDVFITRLQLFASNSAPSITTPPAGQTSFFGSNVVFTVGLSSGTLVTYQWQLNGNRIVNATNSFLRVTNVQYASMGNYSVVVSNAFGVVTSTVARLTTDLLPEFVWLRRAGGVLDDSGQSIATDSQGNLFVAGFFKTNAAFETVILTNAGQEDIFLAKYNATGELLWVNTAGGVSGDSALSLAVDTVGSPVIAGTFASALANFGPYTLTNTGSQDIFVAKYDAQGGILWAKRAGYIYSDQANAVAVDSGGNTYLAGFGGLITSLDGIWLTNSPGTNFLVAKYDPAGNVIWAKTAFGTNTCLGSGITVDHDTNILVTGYLLGRADFGAGVILNTNSALYGGTVFLAKYDPAGNLKWTTKGIGGAVGYGQNIKTDAAGNIFATASMRSYGTYPLISKYDSTGKRLWTRGGWLSCCTGDYLTADGLALDLDGNPYICGTVSGSAYFENYSYPINRQGYVAKYRGSDGALFWAQRLGQAGYGIAVDGSNNAYLAGRFTGPGYFGPTDTSPSAGLNDAFVTRIGVKGPDISVGPVDQYVVSSSNAVLRVTASGTGPLGYQWLFNGTALNGATGSSLSLTNFLPGNAGAYSVVVQNTSGSVTSQPAVLTLVPVIQIGQAGDNVVLDWLGTFVLQSATNAEGPYLDLLSGANSYTNEPVGPQRFFRLRSSGGSPE